MDKLLPAPRLVVTRAGFGGPKVVCAALELQSFFGGRKLVSGDVRFLPYFVRFTPSFGHRLEVALTVTFDPKQTSNLYGQYPWGTGNRSFGDYALSQLPLALHR